ncbi:MAG: superoxide dismutase [Bacteroidales bacterium]|nr:superoxide dismutase [Bacteroidales bacterium]
MKTLLLTITWLLAGVAAPADLYVFKALPYAYDALEPYIDAQTMEIHYDRHHRAYYNNFIAALESLGHDGADASLTEIFANISRYPAVVRNNAGGYYNHQLFWENMAPNTSRKSPNTSRKSPNTSSKPSGKIAEAIDNTFGSLGNLKKEFSQAGATRFGSGWAWLSVDKEGNLFVSSTPNQDNPLMDVAERQGIPLLAMDVWEHAYYLKYQNKRADYIEAFWNVICWEEVGRRYEKALDGLNISK